MFGSRMCLFQLCSCAFKSVRELVVCTCFGVRSCGDLTWMCFPFLPVKEQQVTSRDKLNASHFFLLVFMFGSPCLVVLRTCTQLCLRDQLRVGLMEHALGGLPVSQGLPLYPFSGGKCLTGVSSVSLCKHPGVYLQEFTPGSDLIAETHHLPFPVTT